MKVEKDKTTMNLHFSSGRSIRLTFEEYADLETHFIAEAGRNAIIQKLQADLARQDAEDMLDDMVIE